MRLKYPIEKSLAYLTHYRNSNQGMGRRGLDSGEQVLPWFM